ncbi:MAG: hypothetical protein JWQ87_5470 [Candidatus Sulfotelmatobacter sp.]|nr:hypothetical protein [Candidatus Sulfotelmatobacter sp.]
MSAYNITTVRPRAFLHSSGFREVIDSLSWALAALGHQVNVTENWFDAKDTNIVFGAELLAPNQPQSLPPGTIIYNLEQPSHPNLAKVQQIVLGSKCTVWDYSLVNVQKWRKLGANVHHVPIGYTPNLTRIPKAIVQDIDVLFLGWMTPRRVKIVEELRAAGLNVVASDKCYGGGRDNLISRAKVCLNVHHDGRNLFEIVRVSYLLANRKVVVTEKSADDDEYIEDLDGAMYWVDYGGIVTICKELCKHGNPILEGGTRWFTRRDYVATVKAALSEPTPQEKVAARYKLACESGDMKDFAPFLKDKAHGTCLEIGVRDGASTAALLGGVEKNGGLVLSVDAQDCGSLFAAHPQWKFIQSNSQNPKLKVPPLDVLLIDGDHTREGYRADLERFYPLVKDGGIILTHDIKPEPGMTLEDHPGSDYPSIAIREEFFKFAAEHNLEHEEIPGKFGMGMMIKRANPDGPSGSAIHGGKAGWFDSRPDSDESWQASEAILQSQ